ncbi:hypothetical protein [Vibrio atypicus]|uniref:hypothetical protein n=1 Tax=Vibrio atypicus TaxID=558271 RepID=UPI003736BEF9
MTIYEAVSITIAICAIVVAVSQTYLTRKHNRLSVRPSLHFDIMHSKSEFRISVKNKGLGPAIIKNFRVLFNGEELVGSIFEIANEISDELEIAHFAPKVYMPGEEQSLLPNEELHILRIPDLVSDSEELARVREALDYLDLQINYLSIYGERYSSRGPNVT